MISCRSAFANEDALVKQSIRLVFVLLLTLWASCGRSPESDRSFDQICELVRGKTAAEVEEMLGSPDMRAQILQGDERWIWWNYTYLDGDSYTPEMKGRTVHLEILFQNPFHRQNRRPAYSEWRLTEPLAVSYLLPTPRI